MAVALCLSVVLVMVQLSVQQSKKAAPQVYSVTGAVDWIGSCKNYTGRSYHVFIGTECKDWFICEDGEYIDHDVCPEDKTFSKKTTKCETGINCFIEEEMGFVRPINLFVLSNTTFKPVPFAQVPFSAKEIFMNWFPTSASTELSSTTPDPRGSRQNFNFMTGFVLPVIQKVMTNPILLPTLSLIFRTTFENNVPGAERYLTIHDNLTFAEGYVPQKEILQSMRSAFDRVSPIMKDILMLRMPDLAKVIENNRGLLEDIFKELRAKLAPLGDDLFDLLKRYAEAAFQQRNEKFDLVNIHKDIESFVTVVYVVARNLVYDLYEEKITSFISV